MTATEALSQWIVRTQYGDMPEAAVTAAKYAVLDTMGVSLAGATRPESRMVMAHTRAAGGHMQAGVIGSGLRTNLENAAFANGVMASLLDYDATSLPLGHSVCTVLPAILAVGEHIHASGRQLIEAFVVGLEVYAKIGYGFGDRESSSGFSSVGTYGTFAAAAASAKLLGLDKVRTSVAIGIAASHASGIRGNQGTMMKLYHAGNAAAGGVRSAFLASGGWTASIEPLEGRDGFFAAQGMASRSLGLEAYGATFGRPFDIVDPGLAFKKYPSCHRNHRAIDAALKLVRGYDVKPDDVLRVTVVVPHDHWMNEPNPQDGLSAKVSLQFSMAEAILAKRIDIDSFQYERTRSPEIRALMGRVVLAVDPSMSQDYLHVSNPVTIALRNGRELTETVDAPRGDWGNPLEPYEILAKYRANAQRAISGAAGDRLADLVLGLDAISDVSQLMRVATGTEKGHEESPVADSRDLASVAHPG